MSTSFIDPGCSVHLHVRGDSLVTSKQIFFFGGSPPRAWRQLTARARIGRRISVHLHVRGDSYSIPFPQKKSHGSPPRAWRQRPLGKTPVAPLRFTSTCVETAVWKLLRFSASAVHLHVRGDSCDKNFHTPPPAGSPPRAWRQRRKGEAVKLSLPVHLHVRGDSCREVRLTCRRCGSPPRAWRQRFEDVDEGALLRFTSTCVETARLRQLGRRLRCGSPPRAWRQLARRIRRMLALRCTSTCVETAEAATEANAVTNGSPPRAWRQRRLRIAAKLSYRFTSTCVETALWLC